MSPGWGHLITWMDPSVGHLNGILAQVGGSLNYNFQKSQMPGGLPWAGGGEVKPQFDRYITVLICYLFGEENDVQWSYVSMWKNFKWNFILVVVLYLEFKALYYYNKILPKQGRFLHEHAH